MMGALIFLSHSIASLTFQSLSHDHHPRYCFRKGYDHAQTSSARPCINPDHAPDKTDKKKMLLWKQLFSDPSQWWDHRFDKRSLRYPDFKHKETQEALWIDLKSTPEWVLTELAAMAPGTVPISEFSWTSEIERLVRDGRPMQAIELFHQMQRDRVLLHKRTFIRILKACTDLASVEEGRHVHAQIAEKGFKTDMFVGSCLIDMYSKCKSLEDAIKVFNSISTCDVACWNAMMRGYVKFNQAEKALVLFQQMQVERVKPDSFSFVAALNACAWLQALEEGKLLHAKAIGSGFSSDFFVGSSLVDMYSKCGQMEEACRVFQFIKKPNVACWNAMITGYVKCGEADKAWELFRQMEQQGVDPDKITLLGALNACASTGSLDEGRLVHAHILKSPFKADMFIGSCLVDMYVKCGSIHEATTSFQNMQARDVIAFNGMLMGYAMHGLGKEALHLFERMHNEVTRKDGTTFVGLLSACSHAGLQSEGFHHFESITPVYGIPVDLKHCNCMVDLFGRYGNLAEAENIINNMPFPLDVSVCTTLLGACRTHGNMELAERMSEKIHALDPENDSVYVLLGNLYAVKESGIEDNSICV